MSGDLPLDDAALAEVDAAILRGDLILAIRTVRARVGVGLAEAVAFVLPREGELRKAHPERFSREPTPAEDIEAALLSLPGEPLVVEALWDGDTVGWFVVLCVRTRLPDGRIVDHTLTDVRNPGGDYRVLRGAVPPWPEAALARDAGEAVATRLGVPFWFASPDHPDPDAPRWQP